MRVSSLNKIQKILAVNPDDMEERTRVMPLIHSVSKQMTNATYGSMEENYERHASDYSRWIYYRRNAKSSEGFLLSHFIITIANKLFRLVGVSY